MTAGIGNVASGAINGNSRQTETKERGSQGSFSRLSDRLIYEIFSYLNLTETGDCRLWCRQTKIYVTSEEFLQKRYGDRAFNKKRWAKCFGDIGEAPELPKNIHTIMQSSCPFWVGKKVIETHVLFLIPKTIDKIPLTIDRLGELVKAPKQGKATCYRAISSEVAKQIGDQTIDKSYWAIMTKECLPNQNKMDPKKQRQLLADINVKNGVEYQVPHVIEASICVFTEYFKSGKLLFNDKQTASYMRCRKLKEHTHYFCIGGFNVAGLNCNTAFAFTFLPIGALRQL